MNLGNCVKPLARKSQSRRWGGGYLHVLPLLLGIILSCVGIREGPPFEASRVIESVPFYPQKKLQCGPASLAGVLNYWGLSISPEEIATEIYSRSARGTLDADMLLFAERNGLKAYHYRGSLEDIRTNIDSGHPLIVLVDYGFWIYQENHFMVIVGYDDDRVIANSGKHRLRSVPLGGFLRSWERTQFWTLLITPE
jgi:ABC-type bacteriocin/lantibiotic exporter with double-glycine peptidase domain